MLPHPGEHPAHRSRLDAELADLSTGTLTAEEIAGLLLMREGEKLAHDVYVALHDLWQVRVRRAKPTPPPT